MKKTSNKKKMAFASHRTLLIGFLITIGVMVIGYFFYYKNDITHESFLQVASMLKKIDKECKIKKFSKQFNSADFFTVKEFSGDTVGCVTLENPEKWQGPYCDANPLFDEKPLCILSNKEGIFILPEVGCTINGDVVGETIIFNPELTKRELEVSYSHLKKDNKKLYCCL